MRREVYPQDLEPGTKISYTTTKGPLGFTVESVKHYRSKGGVVIQGTDDNGKSGYLSVPDTMPYIFWDDDNQ